MRLTDATHFDKEGFSGDFYISEDEKKGFNALRVDVHGKHPRKKVIGPTRVYFVVEGNGTFTIGTDTQEVQPNDLYIINPGEEYEYEGNMILFEFNVSSDNSFKDQIL